MLARKGASNQLFSAQRNRTLPAKHVIEQALADAGRFQDGFFAVLVADEAELFGGEERIGHYARPPLVGCEKNSPSIKNSPAISLTFAVNFELMRTFTKILSSPVETTSTGIFFNTGNRPDISLTRRPVFAFNVLSICDFLSMILSLIKSLFMLWSASPLARGEWIETESVFYIRKKITKRVNYCLPSWYPDSNPLSYDFPIPFKISTISKAVHLCHKASGISLVIASNFRGKLLNGLNFATRFSFLVDITSLLIIKIMRPYEKSTHNRSKIRCNRSFSLHSLRCVHSPLSELLTYKDRPAHLCWFPKNHSILRAIMYLKKYWPILFLQFCKICLPFLYSFFQLPAPFIAAHESSYTEQCSDCQHKKEHCSNYF